MYSKSGSSGIATNHPKRMTTAPLPGNRRFHRRAKTLRPIAAKII
jgi:hypothetical protein